MTTRAAPAWLARAHGLNTYLTQHLLGGPRVVTMAWVINLHKLLIIPVVALLMFRFDNYSTVAWIYLALHGTYGLCWLLKHAAFRDPSWETRVTLAGAGFLFLLLATYWVAPFVLISGMAGDVSAAPPNWYLALCIGLFALGMTIMIASDCQKHFTLKHGRRLITDGMFKAVRHPNYLGEMMLYGALALLVGHWIPWAVLAYWWLSIFLVNIMMKEVSLSRYPEWPAYKARSGMLLPHWTITGLGQRPAPAPQSSAGYLEH
jgi:protein-S-isoprenylcysteine O-methyltransferase Ste14